MAIYPACLGIHQLRLSVNLGRWEHEQAIPQPVELTVKFFFKEPPRACEDDDDEEFFCYDDLAQAMVAFTSDRSFKTIEYMGRQLFDCVWDNVRKQMSNAYDEQLHIWLKLHKCQPPIPYLIGGSTFTYTDLPEGVTVGTEAMA